jgi:hypothetical protein
VGKTNKQILQYEGKDILGLEATLDENMVEWIQYIEKNGLSCPGMTTEFDIARSASDNSSIRRFNVSAVQAKKKGPEADGDSQ